MNPRPASAQGVQVGQCEGDGTPNVSLPHSNHLAYHRMPPADVHHGHLVAAKNVNVRREVVIGEHDKLESIGPQDSRHAE